MPNVSGSRDKSASFQPFRVSPRFPRLRLKRLFLEILPIPLRLFLLLSPPFAVFCSRFRFRFESRVSLLQLVFGVSRVFPRGAFVVPRVVVVGIGIDAAEIVPDNGAPRRTAVLPRF